MSDSHHKDSDVFSILLLLKDRDECERFFKDLCTPQEIMAIKERWSVCKLLDQGNLSYREIHDKTKVSLATIGRVARFLRNESYGGYRLMLQRLKKGESS